MANVIQLAGRVVELRSTSESVLAVVKEFLLGEPGPGLPATLQLEIVVDPKAEETWTQVLAASTFLEEEIVPHYRRAYFRNSEADILVMHEFLGGKSWARIDTKSHQTRIVVKDESLAQSWRFLNYPLLENLQLALQYSGYHFIHCGAVSFEGEGIESQGVILCGESGAGKSTLVFSLVEDGFCYLCDDSLGLYRTNEGIRGAALPEWHGLLPDSRTLFPQHESFFQAEAVKYIEVEKFRFPMNRLHRNRIRSLAVPRALVFIERRDVELPQLVPFPKKSAFHRAYKSWGMAGGKIMDRAYRVDEFEVFHRLIEQTECFELHYSIACIGKVGSVVRAALSNL